MERFMQDFQTGMDVTLWMVAGAGEDNAADDDEDDEGDFKIKGLPVTAKLSGFGDSAAPEGVSDTGKLLGSAISWTNRVSYIRRGSVFGGETGGRREERAAGAISDATYRWRCSSPRQSKLARI